MNNAERVRAILNYQSADRLPILDFGFWGETLQKWVQEGYLKQEDMWKAAELLGFDCSFGAWGPTSLFRPHFDLYPAFEAKLIEKLPDGCEKRLSTDGVVILIRPGVASIPAELSHTLVDRKSWEEEFLPKLQYFVERLRLKDLEQLPRRAQRQNPFGLFAGSMIGVLRNWMGVEGLSYLQADDEELYAEIVKTSADLSFRITEEIFRLGYAECFDYLHFWEDICYNRGPLVSVSVFEEVIAPHYRRMTKLAADHDILLSCVDCDGKIDALIPSWLDNGVNVMFPIEVGTWGASLTPWREGYGRKIRGVGGMKKSVFALDFAAVDDEIERLKPMVAMGGYIPCPDHLIPPDAKWENVQYYCRRMRQEFSGPLL